MSDIVSVVFVDAWGSYNAGERAGFDQQTANSLVALGFAEIRESGTPVDVGADDESTAPGAEAASGAGEPAADAGAASPEATPSAAGGAQPDPGADGSGEALAPVDTPAEPEAIPAETVDTPAAELLSDAPIPAEPDAVVDAAPAEPGTPAGDADVTAADVPPVASEPDAAST